MKLTRFAKYAWALVALNVFVILWGALVSSTGSGAGCGDHWPDCNGTLVPINPGLQTMIEFTHRFTSALDGILVMVFVAWAFRAFPARHRLRAMAVASLGFVLLEGVIGALLVRQGWTALDTSVERVIMQPIHLVSTMFLLAILTLTAWWASGGEALQLREQGWLVMLFSTGALGMLFIGSSGAIISLGDLLSVSLGEGHNALVEWLVGLRLWHPAIAVGIGVYLLWLALYVGWAAPNDTARRLAGWTSGLVIAQWLAGIVNVLLRAPVWMQLIHLFLADAIWIVFMVWAAAALSKRETELAEPSPASSQSLVA